MKIFGTEITFDCYQSQINREIDRCQRDDLWLQMIKIAPLISTKKTKRLTNKTNKEEEGEL